MRRVILLFLLLLSLVGCTERAPAEDGTYGVFFPSARLEEGSALLFEPRGISPEGEPVEALLSALLSGPEREDLTSVLPDGLSVESWALADGLLTLDLGRDYGTLSGVSLTLADYSIVLTLCQLPQVEAVTVTVMGEPLPYRDHQQMTPEDLSGEPGGQAETN